MKHTIICTDFKPYRKNTLVGFATIRIVEMRLTIRDIGIHQKNASRWAALPAKPQIGKDGVAVKDNATGKIQYVAILELDDRKTRDAFSTAVVNAVLAVEPDIFDDEAAAAKASPMTSAVTELRLRLRRTGYAPLPLIGKIPDFKGWQTKTDVTEHEINNWELTYPAYKNTGGLTGLMPALDIDIMIEPAALAIEELARDHFAERGYFLTRIGKPPKRAHILRTDKPFQKIVRNLIPPNGDPKNPEKVEILGDGQQLVLAGIHPDTKRSYGWHGGMPGDISLADLPYINEPTAIAFADEAAALLIREHGYTVVAQPQPQPDDDDGADWSKFNNLIEHGKLVAVAMMLLKSGMSAGGVRNFLIEQIEATPNANSAKKARRFVELPRAIRTAQKKLDAAATAKAPATLGELDIGEDTAAIPPRAWLLATQFCRRFLSSVFAPGATGKTALRTVQYLAAATGRPLIGQHVHRRCRVLVLSLEDDIDEMRRRFAAACIHHGIDRAELKGWLFYAAPKGIKLAEMVKGSRQIGALERLLREAIARRKPDILALDPFVKLHALEENDNGAMDFVADLLTQLAIEFDLAVDVPHHVRKGTPTPGDAEAGRGASGIKDAGRLIFTLTRMSEDEAETFGISQDDRHDYIRLDNAKVNLARGGGHAAWFRLVNVQLGNGTAEYPTGDAVQTVEPWTPVTALAGTSNEVLNAILDDIEAGMPNGQRYSDAGRTNCPAWPVVQKHYPGKPEGQCRVIIRTWATSGLLYKEKYRDPIARKDLFGLRVDPTKRPGGALRD